MTTAKPEVYSILCNYCEVKLTHLSTSYLKLSQITSRIKNVAAREQENKKKVIGDSIKVSQKGTTTKK